MSESGLLPTKEDDILNIETKPRVLEPQMAVLQLTMETAIFVKGHLKSDYSDFQQAYIYIKTGNK
jgi:hypothetical protein